MKRFVRVLVALMCGLALTVLSSGYATSQPSSDVRARAAELEKDLEARNQQVAAVDRQFADAQKKVEYANAKVTDAEARLKATEEEIARIKSLLNGRAASIYKIGTALSPFEAVNVQDAKDLTARSKYSDVAAHHDDALVDNLATAKQELSAQRDDADKAHAAAAAERDALAKAKSDADAAAAEQQRLLDQVQGEIEQALRAQTAAKADQARRAQDAAQTEPAPPGQTAAPSARESAPKGPGGPPPVGSGGAGAAAAYAQSQVGKLYCNTSERFGPNCFDCSGLTHSSWRAGGLDIPTVSGAQGSAYPHVSLGDLQPGDLITTSSWSAHVGIWVGGGYVHATNYRNNPNAVKFVEGTGSVVDAVRPH